jgi:Family of unknown function (DUF6069)
MSPLARSKRPATLSRLSRGDRVVAVLATVIAPVLVWLIATAGFGQRLYQPGFGGSAPQELSIWLVAAIAGIAALAGAGVLALIERISRRPAQDWLVVSTAALIVSLGGPLSGEGIDSANKLALVSMHLSAGAVMIPLLYRSARLRQEEPMRD